MAMRTLGFLFVLGSLTAQEAVRLDYPQLLQRLVDVDWLWQRPAAGERCVQFSSYDRRSDKGPGNVDDWYANDDRGKYLRVEDRDGRKEFVMVDVDGPGVLSRLWSANPSGELFFDVDGERVWTVDFKALTSGKVDPVGEPLAGMRSRGANCYLPIPFRKHLKVSASKGDFYYQCNVTTFAAGTQVPSFTPALLEASDAALRATVGPLAAGRLTNDAQLIRVAGNRAEVPVQTLVTRVRVQAKGARGAALGDALRRVRFVVKSGGETTVDVPVLDFFVGGSAWGPWRGAMLAIYENGAAYSEWPMPMPGGGAVELVVDGEVEGVEFGLAIATKPLPATPGTPLLFHASYHQEKGFPSRPFRDFVMLDAKNGPGRYVGCSLLVKNPSRAWWGEGDEKFYVDGETFPSTFGTGTEDFFGYAWCCPEPFQSAFHAQTQCDGPGNYGFTALHRSQILDSVPFQKSFHFDLEVWHWVEGLQLDYSSVAYWYGAPGAVSGLPPVPPAAERTLDRLPAPPVFVAKDALEGEDLHVVSMSGGENERQDLSFRENTFSRDAHRWWKHGKPGDMLVLAVPVGATGTYRVRGAFCMASDYGIVQLTLGGQKLGEPLDCYATQVESSGPRELGTVELPVGTAKLEVKITGKRDKAIPAYMFGLDYLQLEKVQ